MRVYGTSASGNCHKVRMVLEALKLPYTWNEVDTRRGTTRTPAAAKSDLRGILSANSKGPNSIVAICDCLK